jgi:hypothetical protein
MARNGGVGAADERNRRRLKIIYKGTGANNTAGVGGGRQKKHKKRKRNETKKDDGGGERLATKKLGDGAGRGI